MSWTTIYLLGAWLTAIVAGSYLVGHEAPGGNRRAAQAGARLALLVITCFWPAALTYCILHFLFGCAQVLRGRISK